MSDRFGVAAGAMRVAGAVALLSLVGCGGRLTIRASDAGIDAAGDARADGGTDAGPLPACTLAMGGGGNVRVIAAGYKHLPEHAESYATYEAALGAVFREAVAPCLSETLPNLVLLPENTALIAAFIGSRGAAARLQPDSLFAYLNLHGAYADAVGYYTARFPGTSLAAQVNLAVTDTVWRAISETFPPLAVEHGVWIAVSGVMADATSSSDAVDIATLADPDLDDVASVWVADSERIWNQTLVFAPDGEELARRRKVYLVRDEIELLELGFGAAADNDPVDLGFARLGVVISKDAWMPDVIDRLAMLGADLLLQPEAFAGWAVPETPGDWNPAVVMESGWNQVQKHPALRAGAMAALSGNLFDLVFDCQSHVVVDTGGPGGPHSGAYIGNDPVDGFADVGPWVVPDPVVGDPSLTLMDRRDMLRLVGESLLVGGSDENGYAASHAGADVWLPPDGFFPGAEPVPDGVMPLFGVTTEVAIWTSGTQAAPAVVAGTGGEAWIAWQDNRSGVWQVYVAHTADGGASWSDLFPLDAPPPGTGPDAPQMSVDLAWAAGVLHAVWQRTVAGDDSTVWYARSVDDGASWSAPVPLLDEGAPSAQWLPRIAVADVGGAGDPDHLAVSFVTTDWLSAGEGGDRTRVYVASSLDGGGSWSPGPVDSLPVPVEPRLGNQWSPTVTIDPGTGRELVVWIDFRDYSWDVFGAERSGAAAAWSTPVRLDDAGSLHERIHDDTTLAVSATGAVMVAWTDLRDRAPWYGVRAAALSGAPIGASASRSLVGADLPAAGTSRWLPALGAHPDGRFVAVWQDLRRGLNSVRLATTADGGGSWSASGRVDDLGSGVAHAFTPDVAVASDGTVYVTWIDTRLGFPRVRAVAGALP